jgi:hypothetical protein
MTSIILSIVNSNDSYEYDDYVLLKKPTIIERYRGYSEKETLKKAKEEAGVRTDSYYVS